MVAALSSMDLYEQLTTIFPGYAPQYDAIGATPIEIPFYQCVSLSHMSDPFNGYMLIRKDVVFQVIPDLHGPCIRTDLGVWILCVGVHGVSRDNYDPWWVPWEQDYWDR
jgi:hypothetical protein